MIKQIKEYLSKWEDVALMNWKTQHNKDVNFSQIDLYIEGNFYKNPSKDFCSQWQAYNKIFEEKGKS